MNVVVAPKRFRKTATLIKWLNSDIGYGCNRLSSADEQVFFKSKENPETIAHNVCRYAEFITDPIDSDLEALIKKCNTAIVKYIKDLSNNGRNVDDWVVLLAGDGGSLADISANVGRLDRELEKDIVHPAHFITYVEGISWKNGESERIVEQEQAVFFNESVPREDMAVFVARYAEIIKHLPSELKDLLKANNDAILQYAQFLSRSNKGPLDDDLLDNLAGDDDRIYKYAYHHNNKKRVPARLEKTLSNPNTILAYAKHIVNGRLPEEIENHLAKDFRVAAQYAFEVIRAYSSVKLPDVVHSAMYMYSTSSPDDYHIKRYFNECDKDTTVSGSFQ